MLFLLDRLLKKWVFWRRSGQKFVVSERLLERREFSWGSVSEKCWPM
jgi:hypothetical protein